ncbi:hypothetical protein H3H32_20340 [Spirosoma foliorum]|uniref:DUF1795 domain-containing protein n=2 Tax=Spirosoma foliorum TaxID=2710596 RepID=A0A7G5H7D6_9BACT|nr:hypothetical protein H3H32_20340 [Spirosoma foliorum]
MVGLAGLPVLSCQLYGQTANEQINYLSISDPINVQKKAYQLTWSSHPDASLYKQEYLAVGDRFPKYKSMVMIDFVLTAATVDQAVSAKIHELETLKTTNPTVNFTILSNKATCEKMIDCLIGQTAPDDRNSVVERTVFRFKSVKAKTGQQGMLLFAVSTRAYGKDVDPFLIQLKTDKPILVKAVAQFSLPEIRLPKS